MLLNPKNSHDFQMWCPLNAAPAHGLIWFSSPWAQHRTMECPGLGGTLNLTHFHCPRLFQTPSSLAWSPSGMGQQLGHLWICSWTRAAFPESLRMIWNLSFYQKDSTTNYMGKKIQWQITATDLEVKEKLRLFLRKQQQTKGGDLVSEGNSSQDSPSKFSDVCSQKPNLSLLFLNWSFHPNSLNFCNFSHTSLSVISSNDDGWSQCGISCLYLGKAYNCKSHLFSVKRKGKLFITLQQQQQQNNFKKSGRQWDR